MRSVTLQISLLAFLLLTHKLQLSLYQLYGIARQSVMLQTSLLAFRLPVRNRQVSHYQLYTSFEAARSWWQLTIHRWFHLSAVLLLVAISGMMCVQLTMFHVLKICKVTVTGAFLTCTKFKMGYKFPKFSGIMLNARANQYSTKAPSLFRSLILNSRCSCHGRHPFSVP
jgi:hypothetical protein